MKTFIITEAVDMIPYTDVQHTVNKDHILITTGKTMYSLRQKKLQTIIEKKNLDGIAFNAGTSLTYLTGLDFHLMERPVVLIVIPQTEPILVLPELEEKKLDSVDFPLKSFTYPEDPGKWSDIFKKAMQGLTFNHYRIGVEPCQFRLLESNHLQEHISGAELVDASESIGQLRAVKDNSEIQLLRKAVHIAQDALTATLPLIKIGTTEKELASELVMQLLRHGSDPVLPFSPIVSSGPNGANPHAKPTERMLSPGDMLIIDWGATWQGYVSDLTRTFAVQDASDEFRAIHEIVYMANKAGREAGRPGVTCKSVDHATRTIITSNGYGENFTHRTGHGLGMQCHEEPYIRGDNEQTLVPGMTYTVEPGIYLSGKNGVRIEDDVVITQDGAESLSDFPRQLQVIC